MDTTMKTSNRRISNMTAKLYRVEIEDSYYCMAESERDARSFVDEYMRDISEYCVHAKEVRPGHVPTDEWAEPGVLVYHAGLGDILLADVLPAPEPVQHAEECWTAQHNARSDVKIPNDWKCLCNCGASKRGA
jgi:hypothetical protein